MVTHYQNWCSGNVYPISAFIASIKKFSFVIGSPRTYLSRNQCKITWLSNYRCPIWTFSNRPFQSSLVPLLQNESTCETFHMKMSSACSFIFMQIKVIFIRMVSHLDSLWNRGARELGNGLFSLPQYLYMKQKHCIIQKCISNSASTNKWKKQSKRCSKNINFSGSVVEYF